MRVVSEKIINILNEKGIDRIRFANLVNYDKNFISKMIDGELPFPDHIIEKMAPLLGYSAEEIKGWILVDKYSLKSLKMAIKEKNSKPENQQELIFTTKINEFSEKTYINRSILSKLSNYKLKDLSNILDGKAKLSKTASSRLAPVLGVSENELEGWFLADKYTLKTLETAFNDKSLQ